MSDEKPTPDEYLGAENDLLTSLLEAAQGAQQITATIEIARNGKVLFRFRIQPLSEREYNRHRETATKYEPNKRMGGLKMPVDTDTAFFRSLLIYNATVPEDRAKVWDNKEAMAKLACLTGTDMVDKLLLAGEKDAVIDRIDALSGYGADLEQQAKNS